MRVSARIRKPGREVDTSSVANIVAYDCKECMLVMGADADVNAYCGVER